MKIALVSFGHADSAIPLAKAISKRIKIDLIFAFSLDMRKNNVIDFENLSVKTGLQDESTCQKAFSEEVKTYIGENFKLRLFLYKNLKLKSLDNWKLSKKFAKLLKKYDVIHFNGKNLNVFQIRFFLPFKKFVYTIHDLENHTGERAKNILARKFNPIIIKSKSHVIIQNKTDYEWVINNYPKNEKTTHFIPFGKLEIYKQYKTEHLNLPECDVLFFGRISPYKGIEYFIDAVNKLKKDFINIKAIIAGSGKFYFDTTTISEDPAFTIINKFLQSDELVAIIKGCKIVVCPYIDATQSGVAMTAFTFNKPVVATETGGFKDVIINGLNGFLVPTSNSEAIYEKVKLLLLDNKLLNQMSENIAAQGDSGEFSWNKIAENYISIYQKALE
jgi:glycosyltransferase involved in cell wall biosynthesis